MRKTKKKLLVFLSTLALVVGILRSTAFASTSASQTVTIGATIDPTTTLSVSTNTISFGTINPLTTNYNQNMEATVQSNGTYALSTYASDDFKTADATPKVYDVSNLGIKLSSDSNYQTMTKSSSNPVVLASAQPATADTTYNINLQLNTQWLNATPGSNYSTTLNFQVAQQ